MSLEGAPRPNQQLEIFMGELSKKLGIDRIGLSMLKDEINKLKPGQTCSGEYNGHKINVKRTEEGRYESV